MGTERHRRFCLAVRGSSGRPVTPFLTSMVAIRGEADISWTWPNRREPEPAIALWTLLLPPSLHEQLVDQQGIRVLEMSVEGVTVIAQLILGQHSRLDDLVVNDIQ